MTPDLYTAIGIFGTLVILAGYLLSRYHPGFFWLATLGFFINWAGDSMDGTLARHRRIERPIYGFFIDHATDAICQVIIFVGLGASPYISFNIAMLTLVAYLLVTIMAYIRTIAVGEFQISFSLLGPTEARALAILLNTAMFFFGGQLAQVKVAALGNLRLNVYDLYVGAIGMLLLYFFLTTAVHEAVRLVNVDKK